MISNTAGQPQLESDLARSRPANFWYYRDQRGLEVDFVLDSGGELSFMECK